MVRERQLFLAQEKSIILPSRSRPCADCGKILAPNSRAMERVSSPDPPSQTTISSKFFTDSRVLRRVRPEFLASIKIDAGTVKFIKFLHPEQALSICPRDHRTIFLFPK